MRDPIFDRVFGQNRRDSDPLIGDDQVSLTSFVFDFAHDEISLCGDYDDDDADSVISFEQKIESVMIQFHSIVEIFTKSKASQETFLKRFAQWASPCKKFIESLRKFAEEMQTDKFNSDIARLVGTVVSTMGGVLVGLSFLTPLAAVTVPLAVGGGVAAGVGGGVVVGTSGTEMVRMMNRLEEVKALIEKEKERFSAMAHWFAQPEALENAINSLVDFDIIKEIAPDVHRFVDYADQKNMTDEEFQSELKDILKDCIRKMNKDNSLAIKYGKELAPIVITFIFVVCLLKKHNLIVLDCVLMTQRFALSLTSVFDFGVLASVLIGKFAAKNVANTIAKCAIREVVACFAIIVDVINIIAFSISIHKPAETEQTKKIKEVAEKFEKIFLFIEAVYNETKKYKSTVDKIEWRQFLILQVPDDAEYEDLKTALRRHLPEEGWRKMKIKKLKTKFNNWIVKIPAIHSEKLVQQTEIKVKGKNCTVTE